MIKKSKDPYLKMEKMRKKKFKKPRNIMRFIYPIMIFSAICASPAIIIFGFLGALDSFFGVNDTFFLDLFFSILLLLPESVQIFFVIQIIILLITGMIYGFYKLQAKIAQKAKEKIAIKLNQLFFENNIKNLKYYYDIDHFENPEDYYELGFKENPFNFYSEKTINITNILVGAHKKIKFAVANIDYYYLDEKDYRIYDNNKYKGRLYIYDFKTDLKGEVKVFEKGALISNREYGKIETEMIEFNENFNVYTTNKTLCYKLLNARLIEKINKMKNLHGGKVFVYFIKNKLFIFINNHSDILYINLEKPIIKKEVESYFNKDIKLITQLINDFALELIEHKVEKKVVKEKT